MASFSVLILSSVVSLHKSCWSCQTPIVYIVILNMFSMSYFIGILTGYRFSDVFFIFNIISPTLISIAELTFVCDCCLSRIVRPEFRTTLCIITKTMQRPIDEIFFQLFDFLGPATSLLCIFKAQRAELVSRLLIFSVRLPFPL